MEQVQSKYKIEIIESMHSMPPGTVNEIVLIDEKGIELQDLLTQIEGQSDSSIVYVVDDVSNAKQAFASAHGMHIVRANALMSYLEEIHTDIHKQPVLAFWGVLPQLGTTTIALAVANQLALSTGMNVGILGLNLYNPGTSFAHDVTNTLDDVRPLLSLKQLTPTKLRESMQLMSQGVWYLPGPRNPLNAMEYQPEEIAYLISNAKQAFELVIVDVGSILNTAAALQSLVMATLRYVVTKDLLECQERFISQSQYILKSLSINTEEILLIGNQMRQPNHLRDYAKTMNVLPVAAIPSFPELPYYSENEEDKLRLYFAQKKFKQAIEQIVNAFSNEK
ncbi:AAA family ATPase [Alicyclobacillus fodiniaquatilis]|uniref:CpaE family protein n=1 Tax=Alicyclobacillus fodiniaquatilis TaxID=1661150 RepID=A0ABW4JGH2_9BACL